MKDAIRCDRAVRRFWESPWPFAVLMVLGLVACDILVEFFTLDAEWGL